MQHHTQQADSAERRTLHSRAEPGPGITLEALSILRQGREATLATLRSDGWPQATIINYVNDDEHIYFDCSNASQKAHNIAKDNRISLALVAPYTAFGPIYGLSIAGHAKLVNNSAVLSHVLDLWDSRYSYMRERLKQDLSEFSFYSVVPTVVTMPDYAAGLGHRR